MRRSLKAVAVSCALSVLCFANAAPVAKEKSTKLLYPTMQDGKNNLVLVDIKGGDPKNLNDKETADTNPAWSPDGKQIAVGREGAIHVMDADGGNVKQITKDDNAADRLPAWSPDGKQIVFVRNQQIFVMDADGSNQKNVSNNKDYEADPAWSPDGKKIAFASNRSGGGFRVYVMDPDGSNVTDVSQADNPNGYTYPAWSADGKKLYFSESVENGLEVFVCDADGSNKKQLTKLGGANTHSACSPDGEKIAFQHFTPGAEEAPSLYVMDIDGGNPKELLKGKGLIEGGRPAW